jgi:hypothetical protein
MPHPSPSNVLAFPGPGRESATTLRAPRALWELPDGALCPVVGGCLPLATLREALADLVDGVGALPAFDLHVAVVGLCGTRNAVSERLQDTLDAEHADAVEAVAGAPGADALAAVWTGALATGNWGGALWAVLTHRACTDALAERLLRDVHMAQHGAHAALAAERDRARALAVENGLLHARLQELLREASEPRRRSAARGAGRRWFGAFGSLQPGR